MDRHRGGTMRSDDLLSRLKSQCRCMSQPPGKCFSCQAISHIAKLEAELEAAKADIAELNKRASQRGARMQIMREWMIENEWPGYASIWQFFLRRRQEADDWFDPDGVPVREGSDGQIPKGV